ncbi:pyruvate phosphate dikinase [Melghirimyces thermohalophilus]|uniref:Pyruvate, phosphate dikinase n=1 Tax=Melghirimyces thermohalophilus TaxID=1236220 RepID=A0A1G6P3M2_9BACL|nr:pyruvate, phosphate dikinase [Melghirimyces thermohalophilus]SDC74772.1 pyruvate phosphate dikinase [Melghirimyces thermohalophilus]
MSQPFIIPFTEGSMEQKHLMGGKGANLGEMTQAGLPVPPGFTLTTAACLEYYENGRTLKSARKDEIRKALDALEEKSGKKLGDPANPLLVSVRSGAVISMPGMMDTVLNLGLNDETVQGLEGLTESPRFAYDCYRRFIQMYGDVVLGIPHYRFERVIEEMKEERSASSDTELTAADWQVVIERFKDMVKEETGQPFPQDPTEQLERAIIAVFDSWNNQRARIYRKIHKISDDLGTAVNVQMMVFGNMGDDSGTGVAFTRNPSTGEKVLYGEFLINAQGEDVVAGIRTPEPIAALSNRMPAIYDAFRDISRRLEAHYRDMQDIEFTVERGNLYILQTRNGKRTAHAAVKIAADLVEEGVIDRRTALERVDPEHLDQILHRRVDPDARLNVLTKGLPASPGAAAGKLVFDADTAERKSQEGEKVILARPETTPDDIHGIVASQGVLTSRGGMTSHAAVVARGMGKPCICGCEEARIDLKAGELTIGETTLREGDQLSIDGGTGHVIQGEVPLIDPELSVEFQRLLEWADEFRRLKVRANADNSEDSQTARQFGAEGVGLCRTEHMFMEADRIPLVRDMILAETADERRAALDQLLPLQQGDFKGIFQAMDGLPVTIRLLDPPLHEFLPNLEELLTELVQLRMNPDADRREIGEKEELLRKVRALHELNPMLGHRGCRLGMIHPEIYAMQVKAIFQAAAEVIREGASVEPEIMIPLVGHVNELKEMRKLVEEVAEQVESRTGQSIPFSVGTMIEVPRAALTAAEIAEEADFFSFGTNDLTQTTFGYSRDDAEGKFLHHYIDHKVLPENPFVTLDTDGVGRLVSLGVREGRRIKADLKTGICGEHGGEKRSIQFCHQAGLDYVSCSPFRVPLARLAAAQAAILHSSEPDTDSSAKIG